MAKTGEMCLVVGLCLLFAVTGSQALILGEQSPIVQGLRAFTGVDGPSLLDAAGVDDFVDALLDGDSIEDLVQFLIIPQGLRFLKSDSDRNSDPDVLVSKAIARIAASDFFQIPRLVEVMLRATLPKKLQTFGPDTTDSIILGQCPLLSLRRCPTVDVTPALIEEDLLAALSDTGLMLAIAGADADDTFRRKLNCAGCGNTQTYVCSFCWPRDVCNSFWWCGPH